MCLKTIAAVSQFIVQAMRIVWNVVCC